jgi:hypothetical protein
VDIRTWVDFILETAREHGAPGLVAVAMYLAFRYGDRAKPLLNLISRLLRKLRGPDDAMAVAMQHMEHKIDDLVYSILQTMVQKHDACRAYVFEYQGFDPRIQPMPWLYCSNTYERCSTTRPVTPQQCNLQRIPMAAIRFWTRELGTRRQICVHDVDTIKDQDLESWKILASQQISSVYCASIDDINGNPVGFVGLDYTCGTPSQIRDEHDMQSLAMEGVRIAGLLVMRSNGTKQQLAGLL